MYISCQKLPRTIKYSHTFDPTHECSSQFLEHAYLVSRCRQTSLAKSFDVCSRWVVVRSLAGVWCLTHFSPRRASSRGLPIKHGLFLQLLRGSALTGVNLSSSECCVRPRGRWRRRRGWRRRRWRRRWRR